MPPPNVAWVGPAVATGADIEELNRVFSEAFTERYHRDGMRSVRVPVLNPAVWHYAFAVAGEGAMLWRDEAGAIVGFNMAHLWGAEGWMGPLAVRTDWQGRGLGRRIVREGIGYLKRRGAKVIGLETMPRTVENIGFYSGIGFRPGHLTLTMSLDVSEGEAIDGSTMSAGAVAACRELTDAVRPGSDYSREIAETQRLDLGDLTVVPEHGAIRGFALWQHAALAPSRAAEDLRILKLVAADFGALRRLIEVVGGRARGLGIDRVSVRCETREAAAYAELLAMGFKVQWTDLRMTLDGYAETPSGAGVAFSNWEI